MIPDKLKLNVIKEVYTIKNSTITILKENTNASGDIPPQYVGNFTLKIANII
jgi:hypothetical protein